MRVAFYSPMPPSKTGVAHYSAMLVPALQKHVELEANRVEAALVIEPLASIINKQRPDWHVIFNGAEGWKEITGDAGWEIGPAMRADLSAK